ncbi:MAG: NAD(P)/FAD-dependent oxidoreductase [Pseudomonadota bacterium]
MDLMSALSAAEDRLLIAVLVQHTGDLRWIREFAKLALPRHDPKALPPNTASALRARLHQAIANLGDSLSSQKPLPEDDVLAPLVHCVTGEPLGDNYLNKLRADFGFEHIEPVVTNQQTPDIILVGSGFSGISMAIELRKRQIPFRWLERHRGHGGVWYENTYPGCGVDSPSHVYAVAANTARPEWTRYFVKRDEIRAYIERTLARFDLLDALEYDREVTSMRWQDGKWSILSVSSDGRTHHYHCDIAISAVGTLNQPKTPEIPNINLFEGEVFHTARWRHDVVLPGKRVGMIGNGSSGFQAGPYLAETAGQLIAFQRSPAWAGPNPRVGETVDAATDWLLRNVPDYSLWHRFDLYWRAGDAGFQNLLIDPNWTGAGISAANERVRARLSKYLQEHFEDRPDLLKKMTPSYPPYTKRLVVDNGWYSALRRKNVELVTETITGASPSGVITSDGRHHDLDVIIYATGFHGTRFFYPMQIRGDRDQTPTERSGADDDFRSYLGITMPGFPNLFSLFGPNSSIGHGGSSIHIAECQAHYIATCIFEMIRQSASHMEVTETALQEYSDMLDRDMSRMVWNEPGINSRYRNRTHRVVTNHPWSLQQFWDMTRIPDLTHYKLQ